MFHYTLFHACCIRPDKYFLILPAFYPVFRDISSVQIYSGNVKPVSLEMLTDSIMFLKF